MGMKKTLLGITAAVAMGAGAGAALDRQANAVPVSPPGIISPRVSKRQRRRLDQRKKQAAAITRRNADSFLARAGKRMGLLHDVREDSYIAIQRMTNWQRHQWAKAGYPTNVDHYAAIPRRSPGILTMGKSMKAKLIKYIRKTHSMTEDEARQYYNSRTPEQKRNAALQMQEQTERVSDYHEKKRAEAGV